LIQAKLSQGDKVVSNTKDDDDNLSSGVKKESRAPVEKLKASNFPATLLRIGSWEGDLVAKCYFAKQKLVWEVLEGELKSKIEIQWSDITALKANCPDVGPSTLSIVVSRQPLFFRETNPQPRKHTLWQTATDFTGGQAIKSSSEAESKDPNNQDQIQLAGLRRSMSDNSHDNSHDNKSSIEGRNDMKAAEEDSRNVYGGHQALGMSRKDSFGELLQSSIEAWRIGAFLARGFEEFFFSSTLNVSEILQHFHQCCTSRASTARSLRLLKSFPFLALEILHIQANHTTSIRCE
ncbi:hypothetical protein RYX36_027891, partial [Vicia faba]